MTMPQGRLWQPDHPAQEVLANGAACGDMLRGLAKMWDSMLTVHYPLDYFGEDEDPVKTPISEATMHYGAEDLPILAWIVAPGGGLAAAVVDLLERPREWRNMDLTPEGHPVSYADCKVIRGTPGEILPREIREKMGLR